jgi:osmoprotectant transport system substrate-binding protein
MYWEYTGTAWLGPLGNTDPVTGEQAQFDAVKKADAANGITWFAMAGANNAYAIAANPDAAKEFNVATIGDWAKLAQQNPQAATLCTAAEFPTRNDGLPAVEKKYGFDLPDADVAVLDFGLVYTSVAARKPCNFAVVFGTDAQVLANKLVVLQDDKQALATYNVAVSMRTPAYEAHAAQFEAIFGAIAKQLTTQKATELNSKVDIDGEAPEDVAKEFLTQANIIGG